MPQARRATGFTLIELLIVIVIVGVLASIAVPSWSSYVQKSRRADAMAALLNVQLLEEKWRANDTDYGSATEIGLAAGSGNSADGYYTITVSGTSAAGFTATAAPYGKQSGDSCGTYAVNQDGPVYSGYANADCWGH